jgi:hypothetical protein
MAGERLRVESDKWKAGWKNRSRKWEIEQATMAEAVTGMCCCFWEREIKQLQFTE